MGVGRNLPGGKTVKRLLFLMLVIFPFTLTAQEAELRNVEISWESGIITFDVTAPFPDKSVLPATRFRVEQKILQQAPKMIVLACRQVILDSWYTVEDRVQEDPDLFRSLEQLTDGLDHSFSRPTGDNRSLTMRFVLPIYPDLAGLFFVHEQARTIDPPIGYAPTADFTGIIILAERPLPERGTDNRVRLNPCVFPRILNEDLTPVSDRDHMEPEYLSRWGTAGYARGYSLEDYEERIGTYPLRIPALEIFGRNQTDLVISRKDAERILVSENNRRLLREGRVVIIYSE
jgi:hypothetical protein